MNWFKHDTDAITDAKVKKLIMRYGAEGYAIYFHCIELISGNITESNITFQLEHDAEIIADNLKIKSEPNISAIGKVNNIMSYIIELGLFECSNNTITCFKIAKRLDQSMTSNVKMRSIIDSVKKNHDKVMINHDKVMQDKISKNRIDKQDKKEYGELNNVYLSELEYNTLIKDYGIDIIINYINRLSLYEKIGKYKNHNLTIRNWLNKANVKKLDDQEEIHNDLKEYAEQFAKNHNLRG